MQSLVLRHCIVNHNMPLHYLYASQDGAYVNQLRLGHISEKGALIALLQFPNIYSVTTEWATVQHACFFVKVLIAKRNGIIVLKVI